MRYLLPLLDPANSPSIRIAALASLEGCRDAAAVAPILATLADVDSEVRVAGLAVARTLLEGPHGADVLDVVTGLALAPGQPVAVRRAAVAALADLPARTLRPLVQRLRKDADPAVRALVEPQQIAPARDPASTLTRAAEDQLPSDPDYVLSLVAEAAAGVPLPTLHRLVGAIRAREEAEARPSRRRDWLTVRGAVHQALAARASRVAAYDLREAIESAQEPLPDDFLRAAAAIRDATVLEALAGAYVRATGSDAARWRSDLADAIRAIVAREQLTTRHGAVKRLRARHGEAMASLLPR
jgi:hypothetical protein